MKNRHHKHSRGAKQDIRKPTSLSFLYVFHAVRISRAGYDVSCNTNAAHSKIEVLINNRPWNLLPVPQSRDSGMSHLLLQLENAVHQSFARRRASRHVDIHWDDSVTPSHHGITVVIIAAAIRAAAHADHPSRFRHLVVHLSQRRSHLVGQRAGYNHDIALSWGRSENNAQSVLVVTRCGKMHHLYSAAGEAEGQWPERPLPGPVGNLVECRESVLHRSLFLLLRGQRHFAAQAACHREP